jgi:hypothetical protein
MSAAAVFPIPTGVPIVELARRTTADVERHGAVVLLGRRNQARQLRRVQAAVRAAGYQAHYFSYDTAGRHLLTVEPAGPSSRALAWWGPSS